MLAYFLTAILLTTSLLTKFFGDLYWVNYTPETDYQLGSPLAEKAETKILLGQKIDINHASSKDFEALRGIGPALARQIIAHRGNNGPFQSINEIKEVRGIGEAKFKSISQFIDVR